MTFPMGNRVPAIDIWSRVYGRGNTLASCITFAQHCRNIIFPAARFSLGGGVAHSVFCHMVPRSPRDKRLLALYLVQPAESCDSSCRSGNGCGRVTIPWPIFG